MGIGGRGDEMELTVDDGPGDRQDGAVVVGRDEGSVGVGAVLQEILDDLRAVGEQARVQRNTIGLRVCVCRGWGMMGMMNEASDGSVWTTERHV